MLQSLEMCCRSNMHYLGQLQDRSDIAILKASQAA